MGAGICRICGCGCLGEGKEKGGEPLQYDPDFKGPIHGKQRWPTDIICLALFIVFMVLMFAIGIYSWVEGNPQRLINPVDSEGRLCGVDDEVEDKPYLLFFDLTECIYVVTTTVQSILSSNESTLFACPTTQVCVEHCPGRNEVGIRRNPVCVDDVDTRRFDDVESDFSLQAELANLIAAGDCAPYYLTSSDLAGRCIPTIFDLDSIIDEALYLEGNETIDPDLENDVSFSLDTVTLGDIRDGTLAVTLLLNGKQFLLDVYQDLAVVWPGLLLGVFGCLLVGFLYIVLLRYLAPIIIWGGILLAFLMIVAVMIVSWYQYSVFSNSDTADDSEVTSDVEIINDLNEELDWWEYQQETWLAIAIISTIIFVILLLALLCLRKRILIAVALIKVASKAVGTIPSTLFYPLVTWILLVALFTYWVVVAVFLVTSSEAQYITTFNDSLSDNDTEYLSQFYNISYFNNSDCDRAGDFVNGSIDMVTEDGRRVLAQCVFDDFITSDFLLGIQLFHLFGLFWIANFILALGECTLAGAFATYYWTFDKKDVPWFAVFRAFSRTLVYHSGSLAFGALIIAIVQFIRFILGYIQRQLKKRKEARWAQIMLSIFQCCFWCLEKVLRYVNRQAYIEIAIYGHNFCVATCKVVSLLLRNIIRTVVKDNIVRFLLFLGEICIVAAVAGVAWLAFGGYTNYGEDIWGRRLNYYLIPILVLCFVAYLVAAGFTGVFLMAVDTVFICFLEDLERNNGKDQPYFMDPSLQKLMDLHNEMNPPSPQRHGSDETALVE
ncbi:choline transporter-like protein 2 isoform X2 [Dysidea avara]|uniref:choline transporter-like protein 2 isoform X2 n=1 Tax=Dysidea avara TaxID=196820 RepID=UPI003327CF73